MNLWSSLYGLGAQALLLTAALVWVRRRVSPGLGGRWRLVVAPVLLLAWLLPLGDASLLLRLRGLIGDPSPLTCALLLLWLLRSRHLPQPPGRCGRLLGLGLFLGLYGPLLLPGLIPSLGLYGLGWSQPGLLLVVVAAGCWLILRRAPTSGWPPLVGFSLLLWGLGIQESSNLLDALVDPFLVVTLLVAPPVATEHHKRAG